jgi:hypothetical protein
VSQLLSTTPIVDRWNGTTWASENVPKITGEGATSIGPVACSGGANCMAAGTFQTSSNIFTPITEFWNGTTWAAQKLPVPAENSQTKPAAVTCPTATACTVVGSKVLTGALNVYFSQRSQGLYPGAPLNLDEWPPIQNSPRTRTASAKQDSWRSC